MDYTNEHGTGTEHEPKTSPRLLVSATSTLPTIRMLSSRRSTPWMRSCNLR